MSRASPAARKLQNTTIHRRAMPVDFLRVCNAELQGMDCFVGLSASSQ